MASKTSEFQHLPDFLKANTSEIIQDWVAMADRKLSTQPPRQLSFEQFRDGAPDALARLANYLERQRGAAGSPDFMEVASEHGHCRWRQGFNLKDLIRDWGILQRVVLQWVNRFYEHEAGTETMGRSTAVSLVASFFTEAVCGSVARFDELRRDDAARMGQELERMRRHFDRINDFRERVLKDLSHDMRSPLTAISGASCVLKTEADEQKHGNLDELGDIIEDSVNAALKLLDSLQDLSHIDAGLVKLSTSAVDVVYLLREVLEEQKALSDEPSRGEVTLAGPGSLVVEADPDKLRKTFQVILQLVRPDRADNKANWGIGRIVVRSAAYEWELQLRYSLPESGDCETAREEINTLLLRRLCLIQFAGFKCETEEHGEQVLTLKFPVRYDLTE